MVATLILLAKKTIPLTNFKKQQQQKKIDIIVKIENKQTKKYNNNIQRER